MKSGQGARMSVLAPQHHCDCGGVGPRLARQCCRGPARACARPEPRPEGGQSLLRDGHVSCGLTEALGRVLSFRESVAALVLAGGADAQWCGPRSVNGGTDPELGPVGVHERVGGCGCGRVCWLSGRCFRACHAPRPWRWCALTESLPLSLCCCLLSVPAPGHPRLSPPGAWWSVSEMQGGSGLVALPP